MGRYPTVNMPAAPDPMATIGDLARVASGFQEMRWRGDRAQDQERKNASDRSVEDAFQQNKGDFDGAVKTLEGQGRYLEASTIRTRRADIQAGQQKELAEGLKRAREGFDTASRYLQGVEGAENDDEKARLFDAVRPAIVKALPGMDQYIPQRYADDPGFVKRAIPFGLTASEHAKRQEEAVNQVNDKWKKAGDQESRDKAVLDHLGPYLETLDTGEQIGDALTKAEAIYGVSPMVRERVGEIPEGPLAPEWKKSLTSRLATTEQKPAKGAAAGSFEDYLGRWAQEQGTTVDALSADQVEKARGKYQGSGRAPEKPKRMFVQRGDQVMWLNEDAVKQGDLPITATSRTRDTMSADTIASLKRWRATELGRIDQNVVLQQDPDAKKAASEQIEKAYADIMGGTPAAKAPVAGADEEPNSAEKGQMTHGPGKYTMTDGRIWFLNRDGSFTRKKK